MVFSRINSIKILFILLLTILFSILILKNTNQIETNLAKSILPKNVVENSSIITVMEKPAKTIKIVFESNNEEDLEILKQKFITNINKTVFTLNSFDFSSLLDTYSQNPANFLSPTTKKLLLSNNFTDVHQQALERLYNPTGIQLVELSKDPFLLLTDYLLSNNISNKNNYFDDKYYDSTTIKINSNVENINKEISKLIKQKKELTDKNNTIYLAGTPIHTYYATITSSVSINIICCLITLLIVFLTYHYFKSIKLLIPIALSIAFGFIASFAITSLIYNNFHLITFLFGTTLIGIGIDYSYHYIFAEKIDKDFYKDLAMSFLSTALAFSLLYLLKIDILNQIATFTTIGLFAIFTFIITIYPCINFTKPVKNYNPKLNTTFKKYLIITLVVLAFLGLLRIRFNDNLTSLYTPSKSLIKSEALFNMVSNYIENNGTFIIIKNPSEKNILENEEKITSLLEQKGIDYVSMSKFAPSMNVQKENFKLVKKLYKNKLVEYNDILSNTQVNELLNEDFNYQNIDLKSSFKDLLLNDNSTLIIPLSSNLPIIKFDDVEVVNFQETISSHLKTYRINLLKFIPVIYFLLYFLLLIFYGAKQSLKMFLPIIISTIFVILFISLIGVELNLFNILGILLALGFTIDYSIFSRNKSKKTETAIFLACITTAMSFFLLIFTTFKLISTLALTLSLGIFFNYILIKLFFDKEEV
jgi:predicted exporter